MNDILFVLSATIVIHYVVKVVSCWCGNEMSVPVPLLHMVNGWGYSNTYLTTPAIAYQVYFWATTSGVV